MNADCVNIAASDETYRNRLAAMDWVFVDGIGMRIAGRLLNQPVRGNVNGTDLLPRLCAALATHGRSLYLLGGRPGVAEAAADWARTRYPGLRIAGTRHGYFGADDTDSVVAEIHATRPDVLLVAMGVPIQEAWMERHASATGATVTLGVGGLFDFYSGRIPRAPVWMREIGLEWVYRLMQEPGRMWRRYVIGNPLFLRRALGAARRLRQADAAETARGALPPEAIAAE